MSSSTAAKRERWYQMGAAAASPYLPPGFSGYVCPICLRAYGEDALKLGYLTLEHVPPRKLGGRPIVLTCWKCNNSASQSDSHARNLEDILEFASGFPRSGYPLMCHYRTSDSGPAFVQRLTASKSIAYPKQIIRRQTRGSLRYSGHNHEGLGHTKLRFAESFATQLRSSRG